MFTGLKDKVKRLENDLTNAINRNKNLNEALFACEKEKKELQLAIKEYEDGIEGYKKNLDLGQRNSTLKHIKTILDIANNKKDDTIAKKLKTEEASNQYPQNLIEDILSLLTDLTSGTAIGRDQIEKLARDCFGLKKIFKAGNFLSLDQVIYFVEKQREGHKNNDLLRMYYNETLDRLRVLESKVNEAEKRM